MSVPRFRFASLLTAATLLASSASAQVIYVDAGLNSGLNDGSSWADAHQGIDEASHVTLRTGTRSVATGSTRGCGSVKKLHPDIFDDSGAVHVCRCTRAYLLLRIVGTAAMLSV